MRERALDEEVMTMFEANVINHSRGDGGNRYGCPGEYGR
jgi:hypothetical protein